MPLTESTVEKAALEWFGELGYAIGHGPEIASEEASAGVAAGGKRDPRPAGRVLRRACGSRPSRNLDGLHRIHARRSAGRAEGSAGRPDRTSRRT